MIDTYKNIYQNLIDARGNKIITDKYMLLSSVYPGQKKSIVWIH